MSSSRTESYVLVSTPLPGVTLATVYVETAYSLLCCGEFSDTVTVCQHLTGRYQDSISMVKCDVEHAAAIMYEVYALVGLNDIDVALSTLDMYVLCHFFFIFLSNATVHLCYSELVSKVNRLVLVGEI